MTKEQTMKPRRKSRLDYMTALACLGLAVLFVIVKTLSHASNGTSSEVTSLPAVAIAPATEPAEVTTLATETTPVVVVEPWAPDPEEWERRMQNE